MRSASNDGEWGYFRKIEKEEFIIGRKTIRTQGTEVKKGSAGVDISGPEYGKEQRMVWNAMEESPECQSEYFTFLGAKTTNQD